MAIFAPPPLRPRSHGEPARTHPGALPVHPHALVSGHLPQFLVIGAMKAGTTTFCRDLSASPDIYFPSVKEPHTLCLPEVETPAGRAEYAALFRGAEPGQLCGEGSTGYTKRPVAPDVSARARRVLGPDTKLLYIVREPVDRLVSHHHHLLRGGKVPADINEAVRSVRELVQTSRYAYQLEPWLEAFGPDALRVVVMEEYVKDREAGLAEVCGFLGARLPVPGADLSKVHNAAGNTRLAPALLRKPLGKLTRSQFYKRAIHPRLPRRLVGGIQATLYRTPTAEPLPMDEATREHVLSVVRPEADQLASLMGRSAPIWDFDALYAQRGQAAS